MNRIWRKDHEHNIHRHNLPAGLSDPRTPATAPGLTKPFYSDAFSRAAEMQYFLLDRQELPERRHVTITGKTAKR
jgi:hypothetical protein